MQEKELKEYQVIKKEMKDLERRINKEASKEVLSVYGTVKGSMKEFPYTEQRSVVEMYDPKIMQIKQDLIKTYQHKKQILERIVCKIESYINEIQESELRIIFRLYYIDGLTQDEIADYIHIDRSRVSRKISNYIKNAHKAHA